MYHWHRKGHHCTFLELKVAYCTSFRKLDPVRLLFFFSKKNICSRTGAPESEELCWTYQWYLLGGTKSSEMEHPIEFFWKGRPIGFPKWNTRLGSLKWSIWSCSPEGNTSIVFSEKEHPNGFTDPFRKTLRSIMGLVQERSEFNLLKRFSKLFKIGVLQYSVLLPDYHDFSSTLDLELEQLPELWKL